ncbi:hypothetical protein MaudCBS49596_000188 [Microsporum audouinii]
MSLQPKVFDFDRSAFIGSKMQESGRDDVDGLIFTIYEALTTDDHYRKIPFEEQGKKAKVELQHIEAFCRNGQRQGERLGLSSIIQRPPNRFYGRLTRSRNISSFRRRLDLLN